MIGVSVEYSWLMEKGRTPEGEALFDKLKNQGVESVELRAVPCGESPDKVLYIAKALWDNGLNITVHASSKTVENAVSEVLEPLRDTVANLRQRELVVTVHPVKGDNAEMLCRLSDYISERNWPLRIALENERKLPDKTYGDSLSLVLEAVSLANRENVGICFDMGHFAWYCLTQTDSPDQLPPPEFLKKVIHTHIHQCVDGVTHFYLEGDIGRVGAYLEALDYGYLGVYNLEISPGRFDCYTMEEALLISAATLKANLPFHARLYDDIRLNYDGRFEKALSIFEKERGCYCSLVSSSSYLFNLNGFCWAMDVAFRYARDLAESPLRIGKYFEKLPLMILTHGHEDHFEPETVRALADTEMTWIVPEFLKSTTEELGVSPEKIIAVNAGDNVSFGPLRIKVLEGKHFRPKNGGGTESVGYLISAEGAPSLCFPGDVRDYSVGEENPLCADYCFAHVWLSDCAKEPEKYIPKSEELAEFMLKRSERNILLTHLYENGRKEEHMWQESHADLIAEKIKDRSSKTQVRALKWGDVLPLED